MNLSTTDLQVVLWVLLVAMAAFIAFLMDYFKNYNEQLRERNIELAARQQERDRWLGRSPEAFVEKIAALLRSPQALPPASGTAPAAAPGMSARSRQRAAAYAHAAATPPSEESAGPGSPVAVPLEPVEAVERKARTRPRREPTRIESWVSKEELEKLAERAARIRARYGSMAGEESSDSSPESPGGDDGSRGAKSSSGDNADEVHTGAAIEAAAIPATATLDAIEESPAPDAEPETEDAKPFPSIWREAVEPVSSAPAAGHSALDSEPQSPEAWPIPSSPAQAAISDTVGYWREQQPSADVLVAETPGAAEEPGVSANSLVEWPASSPADTYDTPYLTRPAGADSNPVEHELDIDALFDQTYGNPSWLAMGGADAEGAIVTVLPTGLFENAEFTNLMAESPAFTGVAVSIRINDFAALKPKLNSVEGVEAMNALNNLIRSLLREDRDFGSRAQEDEYVLLFPGDTGDEGQRRLFHLSERLWDFQLRSLGGLALMLSWGGLEVEDQPVADAVGAARERLEESRRGRAKPGSTFRSARRVS